MMIEKLVELLAGEIEVLEESLPQCHFFQNTTCCPDANPGRRGAINRLSYGTASRE
jgi:hypothetical protein